MDKKSKEIETTLDEWSVQVPNGAGKREKLIASFLKILTETGVPEMEWRARNTAFTLREAAASLLTGGGWPGHEVVAITMATLQGFDALIDAQDYGTSLLVSWKAVFNKYEIPYWKQYAHDEDWLDASHLTATKQQDFTALKVITQDALKRAIQNLGNELDEDFSEEDDRSRGIKSMEVEMIEGVGAERDEGEFAAEDAKRARKEKEKSLGIETIEL